jgi:hypothetical protein
MKYRNHRNLATMETIATLETGFHVSMVSGVYRALAIRLFWPVILSILWCCVASLLKVNTG